MMGATGFFALGEQMIEAPQRVAELLDRHRQLRAELNTVADELALELLRQAHTLVGLLAAARSHLDPEHHRGLCIRIDVALQRYSYLDDPEVRARP